MRVRCELLYAKNLHSHTYFFYDVASPTRGDNRNDGRSAAIARGSVRLLPHRRHLSANVFGILIIPRSTVNNDSRTILYTHARCDCAI